MLPREAKTEYHRTLVSTRKLLECCGLPTFHLAWHGNTHFKRSLFESERFRLIRKMSYLMPDGCEPTCLMNNYRLAVAPETIQLVERPDCKFGISTNADQLQERVQDREVISCSDAIAHTVLAEYLQKQFPKKCRFEL